ncbi:MAG: HugZ family protein [Rhizobiaceae bacterium]|nr:HugZ family protein [Rhizobiaceae bacterium]
MSEAKKDVIRPTDAEAVALGKQLLRTAQFGALAVLDKDDGSPFVSRAGVATLLDGTPIILVSLLSQHTQALLADPRCSLLLGEPGKGDPLAYPRISLTCRAKRIERDGPAYQSARRRYLNRHPKAKLYVDLGDFNFFALPIERASLNGGFGKAYRLTDSDLLTAGPNEELDHLEQSALDHMNSDHVDAVERYARAAGAKDGRWRLVGIDAEGVDLASETRFKRLPYPQPMQNCGDLRGILAKLARIGVANDTDC